MCIASKTDVHLLHTRVFGPIYDTIKRNLPGSDWTAPTPPFPVKLPAPNPEYMYLCDENQATRGNERKKQWKNALKVYVEVV